MSDQVRKALDIAAWHDGLIWAIGDSDMRRCFHEATGISLDDSVPLDRLIDKAIGRDLEILQAFIGWWNETCWGVSPDWRPPDDQEAA